MKDTFKVGDVVVLKSGGPKMVVEDASDKISCVWFPIGMLGSNASVIGPQCFRGSFPAEVLKRDD